MDENQWIKDTKPYLIFKCDKCNQYSYVKLTQKFKKCLRCGRLHQVNRIKNNGQIVKGMSNALQSVKAKQNELGKLKGDITLKSDGSFALALNQNKIQSRKSINREKIKENIIIDEYFNDFKELLKSLTHLYYEFPRFMIDLMAEDYSIPKEEIGILINIFKLKGILIEDEKMYYKLNNDIVK